MMIRLTAMLFGLLALSAHVFAATVACSIKVKTPEVLNQAGTGYVPNRPAANRLSILQETAEHLVANPDQLGRGLWNVKKSRATSGYIVEAKAEHPQNEANSMVQSAYLYIKSLNAQVQQQLAQSQQRHSSSSSHGSGSSSRNRGSGGRH